MKRWGLYLTIGAAVAAVASFVVAQPIDSGGLRKVNHDTTLSGDGTNGKPLGVVSGSFLGSAAVAGTTNDLAIFTGAHAVGNYAGSTATACSAGNAVTQTALSAAGALTQTCSAFPSGTGTTGDLTAWSSSTGIGNYAGTSACSTSAIASLSAAGAATCASSPSFTKATAQRVNFSPVDSVGSLTFQSSLDNYNFSSGVGAYLNIEFEASDNSGSVVTGIDSSSLSVGDIVSLCNMNAPTDDGVVALTCEDGNSLPNNQIKTPNCGRLGNGAASRFIVENDRCVWLQWMQPDQGDSTNHKFILVGGGGRTSQQITQLASWFPTMLTEHITGTVEDWDPFNQYSPVNAAQNTTIAVASNGAALPQATINVASTTGFMTSGSGNTTIASGSNGIALPQATINAASTTGFYSGGTIYVTTSGGVQVVTCTGTTSTTFTGCSGGTGTMSTSGAITGIFYKLAIQATANTFLDYRLVACTGKTSSTFTGCTGGTGTLNTSNVVVGNPICEAGGSCRSDDYTTVVIQTVDSSGASIGGIHWATNAYPQGLGPVKRFYNGGPGPVTIKYLDTGSSQNNRFDSSIAANVTIPVGGSLLYHHRQNANYWELVGPPPYTAGTNIGISSSNAISISMSSVACSGDQAVTSVSTTGTPSCGAVGGTLLAVQAFTAGGTYTPTSGAGHVWLRECGGGGGGGGTASAGNPNMAVGGGGGAGGMVEQYVNCAGACTGGTVTIGAAGTGGSTSGGNGGAGGNTSVVIAGTTFTAGGGAGGTGMGSTTPPAVANGGGNSASSSTGDYHTLGAPGAPGMALAFTGGGGQGESGHGGSSPFGTGGRGANVIEAGSFAASGYCSGGGGGATEYGTAFAGAAGAGGLVLLYEYP